MYQQIKGCLLAIKEDRDLPEEPEEQKVYAHHISFNEVTSESIIQLCLNCKNMQEFGISSDPLTRFIQLSSLVTSILAFAIEFGKVSTFQSFAEEINFILKLIVLMSFLSAASLFSKP